MKITSLFYRVSLLLAAALLLVPASCGEKAPEVLAPVLISVDPANGISDLEGSSLTVKFCFDSPVSCSGKSRSLISAGDAEITDILAMARYVTISVNGLQPGKTYTISIPEGCICSQAAPELSARTINYNFSMKKKPVDSWESATDAVKAMKTGWNLGNTLDSNSGDVNNMWIEGWKNPTVADYETAWGQPQATRDLIHMFKQAGFNAIRVPVTWYPHMGKLTVNVIGGKPIWDKDSWTGYEVDSKWMARVKEVVNYVIDEGMYCILNVHHDTGEASTAWLRADPAVYEKYRERFTNLWNQIATEFAGYDDKLLFESFNEMLDGNNRWNTTTQTGYDIINKYNSDFVQTVRATGGNNAYRNLVVNTYAASADADALKNFKLPYDSVSGHLIAEVHSYAPYQFAFEMVNPADQWTKFDAKCESQVKSIIDGLNTHLVSKGIPTIIGEYGCTSKAGETEMSKQAAHYVSTAKKYGIACFYWMNLSDAADRSKPAWTMPALKDAILSAYYDN